MQAQRQNLLELLLVILALLLRFWVIGRVPQLLINGLWGHIFEYSSNTVLLQRTEILFFLTCSLYTTQPWSRSRAALCSPGFQASF